MIRCSIVFLSSIEHDLRRMGRLVWLAEQSSCNFDHHRSGCESHGPYLEFICEPSNGCHTTSHHCIEANLSDFSCTHQLAAKDLCTEHARSACEFSVCRSRTKNAYCHTRAFNFFR